MWDRVMLAPLSYELWAFPFRLALGSPRMYSLLFTDLMFDAFHLMDAAIKINTEVVLPNMEEPIRSRSLNFHSFLVNKAPMEVRLRVSVGRGSVQSPPIKRAGRGLGSPERCCYVLNKCGDMNSSRGGASSLTGTLVPVHVPAV